jgi:sulfur-oxidizing protein SoxA
MKTGTLAALAFVVAASNAQAADKRSGYDEAGPQIRAMQDDDFSNPAFLWVKLGESQWVERTGKAACADCHGDASASMRGTAARYPTYDPTRGQVLSLEQRVNLCRTDHQGLPPWTPESEPLLAMTAYVGLQSRGLPLRPQQEGPAAGFIEKGRALYQTRMGQLNLSCSQCHDDLAGQKLGGTFIPQGHANGYPIYRLEWQAMGSVTRRLRNCMTGIRAAPFAAHSPEAIALELYLAVRADGLKVETPAVRP